MEQQMCMVTNTELENQNQIVPRSSAGDSSAPDPSSLPPAIPTMPSNAPLITNYPYDPLTNIFRYYTWTLDGNPWTLAHVCRSWRATALSYPLLWNDIVITTSGKDSKWCFDTQRYTNGWERCTNVGQLRRALSRAGESWLGLHIIAPTKQPDEENEIPVFWEMMELVGGPKTARWRSVSLSATCWRCDTEWEEYFNLPECSLENLETLRLQTPCLSLTTLASRTSKKLRSADLSTSTLRMTRNEDVSWFRNLRSLCLSSSTPFCFREFRNSLKDRFMKEAMEAVMLPSDHVSQVIASTMFLESLIVKDCEGIITLQGQYYLPNLKVMHISARDSQWLIIASQSPLTHLTLDMGDVVKAPPESDLHFNNLIELHLHRSCALSSVRYFVCPRLEYLSFHECWTSEEQIFELGNHLWRHRKQHKSYSRLSPEGLSIADVSLNLTCLTWILHNMPSIEYFKYSTRALSVDFYHNLASSNIYGTILVPRLRVLSICGPEYASGDDFENLMQNLICFRENNGYPLTSLWVSDRQCVAEAPHSS